MKEIVNKILDVVMFLLPFFKKRKQQDRVVREVSYNATRKEVCNMKTTERENGNEKN